MQINSFYTNLPLNYSNKKRNSNVSFGSMQKVVKDNLGNVTNRTTSYFFRFDLNFGAVTDYIAKMFPNGAKIKNYACSDGSEPYSLAIKLIDKLGLNGAQKYFPIIAKDVDKDAISIAQRGISAFGNSDRGRIRCFAPDLKFEDYFSLCNDKAKHHHFHQCPKFYYEVKPELRKSVKFSLGDIVEDVSRPDFSADVVLARNFFPYLSPKDRETVITQIEGKLPQNGLFCIGDFDYTGDYGTGYNGRKLFKKLTKLKGTDWRTLQGYDSGPKHFIKV